MDFDASITADLGNIQKYRRCRGEALLVRLFPACRAKMKWYSNHQPPGAQGQRGGEAALQLAVYREQVAPASRSPPRSSRACPDPHTEVRVPLKAPTFAAVAELENG
eukprot:CAMPEP_0119518684 /NCGR_PEP_ID=MMETSP1344-20130328/35221_1 /TAXON_ID=236787 /ORGANISM="Florenciella parvula, Strain CCMP2471" /LENGTH=106 /DNA_ID=CAMNT_0007556393 /DNA_START=6 /DNA_END=322 /DNA_ORIENTATION=+